MNLQTSLDLSSELHCILDTDGYILESNSFFRRLLDISTSSLMDLKFTDLIVSDDLHDYQLLIDDLEYGVIRTFKIRLRKPSHEIICLSAKILKTDAGFIHIVANIIVMSQAPLARFRRFFDMSLLDIVIIANQDQQLVYVNQGFVSTLGFSWAETQEKSLLDFIIPKDQPLMQSLLQELQQDEGKNQELVIRCKHQDGSYRWLSWNMTYNRKNLYAIANNVTKKKEQEHQIQHLLQTTIQQNTELTRSKENLKKTLQQLATRNFELDQFVYKVSHDLRAPLTSILGLVNLAKLDHTDTNTMLEYFDMIEVSTIKLDEFIKSLLDFSRNDRFKQVIQQIDMKNILHQVFENLKYFPHYHEIEKEITLRGDVVFFNEYLRIRIILNNLMSNAIKYYDTNKVQHFIKATIDLTSPKFMILTLEDNGIGISEDVRGYIFDMFYRGTELADGSGLGLYITKQTVEKLNGEITIQSKHLEGTTVTLKIPNLTADDMEK